jgi:hypothetical protein
MYKDTFKANKMPDGCLGFGRLGLLTATGDVPESSDSLGH